MMEQSTSEARRNTLHSQTSSAQEFPQLHLARRASAFPGVADITSEEFQNALPAHLARRQPARTESSLH